MTPVPVVDSERSSLPPNMVNTSLTPRSDRRGAAAANGEGSSRRTTQTQSPRKATTTSNPRKRRLLDADDASSTPKTKAKGTSSRKSLSAAQATTDSKKSDANQADPPKRRSRHNNLEPLLELPNDWGSRGKFEAQPQISPRAILEMWEAEELARIAAGEGSSDEDDDSEEEEDSEEEDDSDDEEDEEDEDEEDEEEDVVKASKRRATRPRKAAPSPKKSSSKSRNSRAPQKPATTKARRRPSTTENRTIDSYMSTDHSKTNGRASGRAGTSKLKASVDNATRQKSSQLKTSSTKTSHSKPSKLDKKSSTQPKLPQPSQTVTTRPEPSKVVPDQQLSYQPVPINGTSVQSPYHPVSEQSFQQRPAGVYGTHNTVSSLQLLPNTASQHRAMPSPVQPSQLRFAPLPQLNVLHPPGQVQQSLYSAVPQQTSVDRNTGGKSSDLSLIVNKINGYYHHQRPDGYRDPRSDQVREQHYSPPGVHVTPGANLTPGAVLTPGARANPTGAQYYSPPKTSATPAISQYYSPPKATVNHRYPPSTRSANPTSDHFYPQANPVAPQPRAHVPLARERNFPELGVSGGSPSVTAPLVAATDISDDDRSTPTPQLPPPANTPKQQHLEITQQASSVSPVLPRVPANLNNEPNHPITSARPSITSAYSAPSAHSTQPVPSTQAVRPPQIAQPPQTTVPAQFTPSDPSGHPGRTSPSAPPGTSDTYGSPGPDAPSSPDAPTSPPAPPGSPQTQQQPLRSTELGHTSMLSSRPQLPQVPLVVHVPVQFGAGAAATKSSVDNQLTQYTDLVTGMQARDDLLIGLLAQNVDNQKSQMADLMQTMSKYVDSTQKELSELRAKVEASEQRLAQLQAAPQSQVDPPALMSMALVPTQSSGAGDTLAEEDEYDQSLNHEFFMADRYAGQELVYKFGDILRYVDEIKTKKQCPFPPTGRDCLSLIWIKHCMFVCTWAGLHRVQDRRVILDGIVSNAVKCRLGKRGCPFLFEVREIGDQVFVTSNHMAHDAECPHQKKHEAKIKSGEPIKQIPREELSMLYDSFKNPPTDPEKLGKKIDKYFGFQPPNLLCTLIIREKTNKKGRRDLSEPSYAEPSEDSDDEY